MNQTLLPFVSFPKIPRLFNDSVILSEKLDGTNAQVYISEDNKTVLAGSRTRWITPENDNYGFALWVQQNREELLKLGPGNHYGEWWGCGINRNYGLHERRFSLFNVHKWTDDAVRPKCCQVVPTLEVIPVFDTPRIHAAVESLRAGGSVAAPGFDKPEGIIVFHCRSNHLFKVLLENDDKPKGAKR